MEFLPRAILDSKHRSGHFLPLKSQQQKAGRPREERSTSGLPLAWPARPWAQEGTRRQVKV